MSFENLGLSPAVVRAVADEGYTTPTPIQAQAIPLILAGQDVMGCAQTGTGKTAAFALPLLDRLTKSREAAPAAQAAPPVENPARAQHSNHPHGQRNDRNDRGHNNRAARPIRCLILSPTRELTAQIAVSLNTYGRHTGLKQTTIYGGVSQHPQTAALRSGVDVVIATPGRLLDLMNQGYIRLEQVEILVLDEADQMLDMGFLPDLKRIVSTLPKNRQTLMFSATMPEEIRRLAEVWLRNPQQIRVAPASTTAETVLQQVLFIDSGAKGKFLNTFLDTTARGRTLVFTRTKHGADKVVKSLIKAGIPAAAIHGNKSQNARQKVLLQFKSKRPPVLVATDVAARGLDIDDVTHVINYDMPNVAESYVHRIGRTGRAGATGTAISFCSREERKHLRDIERLIRQKIAILEHPEAPLAEQQASQERSAERRSQQGSRDGQNQFADRAPATDAGTESTGGGDRPRKGNPRAMKTGKFQWFRSKNKKNSRNNAKGGFSGNANPGGKPVVGLPGDRPKHRGPHRPDNRPRPALSN